MIPASVLRNGSPPSGAVRQSYAFFSKLSKNSFNWKKAIAAYEKALKILPDNTHNMKRSELQIKLGEALLGLAGYEETIENTKSAIYIFQEAFRGLNTSDLLKYGEALNQFGAAYYVLAVAETFNEGDRLHSLAYQEMKSVTDGEAIPKWYAFARDIPDDQSMSMAKMEEKSWNSRQALELLHQALQVYSKEQQPKTYASIRQNIGNVYLAYYEVDHNLSTLRNAIAGLSRSGSTLEPPRRSWFTLIVELFVMLPNYARSIAKAENAPKAIVAYETALNYLYFERFPLNYDFTKQHKNTCYLGHKKKNMSISIKESSKPVRALKVFTKEIPKM